MADLEALLKGAAAAFSRDEFHVARDLAAEAREQDPESINAWDFHSMACQALGELEEAERSCRQALKLVRAARRAEPDDDKHALRELFLLIRLGRNDEVESLLALLEQRHPGNERLKKIRTDWRLRAL